MRKTLVQLRKERNLTQRSLCDELNKVTDLGFSPASIALYELGKRTPTLKRVKVIANFFNVSIEDINFYNE